MIDHYLIDRFPNLKFVRESYGLNECGLVCLTYPREKKNSVTAMKVRCNELQWA